MLLKITTKSNLKIIAANGAADEQQALAETPVSHQRVV